MWLLTSANLETNVFTICPIMQLTSPSSLGALTRRTNGYSIQSCASERDKRVKERRFDENPIVWRSILNIASRSSNAWYFCEQFCHCLQTLLGRFDRSVRATVYWFKCLMSSFAIRLGFSQVAPMCAFSLFYSTHIKYDNHSNVTIISNRFSRSPVFVWPDGRVVLTEVLKVQISWLW